MIVYAAIRSLITGPELENLGIGIVVIGFASVANLAVSSWLFRRARETSSPALEGDAAHLRTDAYTSIGVLVGLALVSVTGARLAGPGRRAADRRRDRRHRRADHDGLAARARRRGAARRRAAEHPRLRSSPSRDRGVVGYHQLRTRQAGARRYVDLHVQFRRGTSLEDAHRIGHELQDAIQHELDGADVLIHLEPEDRVRPGEVL